MKDLKEGMSSVYVCVRGKVIKYFVVIEIQCQYLFSENVVPESFWRKNSTYFNDILEILQLYSTKKFLKLLIVN